ncbi:MAG TPA: DUF5682 family protein [Actinocrinis sp.]|uniref:DUF5682 family protein n=1 Tax=Actinocrinis sp. TaxID=1920516 RepID=UPI002DDD89A3|nr:DUF5682 family protein [Actinocrinis sp.]HEV2347746.1 DUF5682 family protein [Actinocrinis sp.]
MTASSVAGVNRFTPAVVLLGVRHHGPGSARGVVAALDRYEPDRILIEGPRDADPLIPLVGASGMEPPVALLAYREQDPKVSAFWPFAAFSPEWSALRYAVRRGIEVGFCDLPAAASLVWDRDGKGDAGAGADGESDRDQAGDGPDPIARLAEAAGYGDSEAWWEDVVEHRDTGGEPFAAFAAIADAMAAVREGQPTPPRDALREAHMRSVLRAALADGAKRVAVICGAYHVPALSGIGDGRDAEPLPAAADDALLARIPKPTKANATALTWVPWTHSRLSYYSGYGAGIGSPGWYQHLFETGDHVTERWLVMVAELLRAERHPVSSAHLIEATRLAESLAALRGRPTPGLAELTEATIAVLCEGREEPLGLISRELVVGEILGSVPSGVPTVPLAADLAREAKRLRLPRAATDKQYDLDLRNPNDLGRSKLFHRLGLLGVDWAVGVGSRSTGTFRESWQVAWEPMFEVRLVEAAVWGTTVQAAATAKALDSAAQTETLGSLTVLVERCLTADLPDAVDPLIARLQNRAALDTDIADLATALPPLANILRYGDVRGTRADGLTTVVNGIAVRIAIGLPPACVAVDDDAARALAPALGKVHAAIEILDDTAIREPWKQALRQVADLGGAGANGLLVGRATRLLRDAGAFGAEDVATRMGRALSRGAEPPEAAGWLEGFLAGSGLVLAHDRTLLRLIDHWLAGLEADRFEQVLPLLRRTFATFTEPERRTIGDRAAHLGDAEGAADSSEAALPTGIAADWVAAALPTMHLLLTGQTLPTSSPLEPAP